MGKAGVVGHSDQAFRDVCNPENFLFSQFFKD